MKDAVIVNCVRTPVGRAHKDKGVYRDVRSDDLAVAVVKALIERSGIDPKEVEDVVLGNTQQTVTFALPAKALYRLGWPYANGDGVYYVGMIVDVNDSVREKNEGNNRNLYLNDDVTINNTYLTSEQLANAVGRVSTAQYAGWMRLPLRRSTPF